MCALGFVADFKMNAILILVLDLPPPASLRGVFVFFYIWMGKAIFEELLLLMDSLKI